MKKRSLSILLVLLLAMTVVLAGCGKSETTEGEADVPTIGIVQIVEHPSLDTIRESILSQLEEEGFVDGKTVKIDYKNAQNDPNNLKTICQSFTANGYDMIIAIATPSAQAALGETTKTPIIFSAVTDPIAAGLVKSLEQPGGNVTGTSDAVSATKILDLALQITPNIKTIGALYSAGEVNSVSVVAELKKYAAEKGIKVEEATIMNSSEIQQAAQSLAGKVDAVFSPIDNTVASAMPNVVQVLNQAKTPFYVAADSMVADGGLATDGVNYVELGKATGVMAAKVLNGEEPGSMPVQIMSDTQVYINKNTAKAIGVEIPKDILDKATILGE
ncbi:ABC transporter substrate-binding protein [Clostridium aminobutyricum]|uniref:ABC transporter substrate-binding protein n=1 Tax=Clostridium aminobutyricum TaxID=33953 RepID=A0A939D8T8_CLOAM|nr:ABC transporter substrate-binding protein [Clostridium aminobutyricum]MBN7773182.1 ABC transporter substrate-binding protein [Clostridium aminobutyricum]